MCDSSFYAAEVQLKFCHVSIKENCFGKKCIFRAQFDNGAQKTTLICTEYVATFKLLFVKKKLKPLKTTW